MMISFQYNFMFTRPATATSENEYEIDSYTLFDFVMIVQN